MDVREHRTLVGGIVCVCVFLFPEREKKRSEQKKEKERRGAREYVLLIFIDKIASATENTEIRSHRPYPSLPLYTNSR